MPWRSLRSSSLSMPPKIAVSPSRSRAEVLMTRWLRSGRPGVLPAFWVLMSVSRSMVMSPLKWTLGLTLIFTPTSS